MAFLLLGLVLSALKLAEIGPVAAWSWWWVLSPFALAAVWWAIADATGLTRQRAMRRMDERKAARRQRDMQALGLGLDGGRGGRTPTVDRERGGRR